MRKIFVHIIFIFIFSNSFSQVYCPGDSIFLVGTNYVAGDLQWQYSYDDNEWFDIEGATDLNHTYYPTSDVYLRLKIDNEFCQPAYYSDEKFVELSSNPDIADAGEDQLNLEGTSTNLNANSPEIGNGVWTIINGNYGFIENESNPNSLFTGVSGETYHLKWAVSNECGENYDFVTINFREEIPFTCGDLLIDSRDNQEYPTVELGNQCWMAKNLNVGEMIEGQLNQSNPDIIEKYCYANDPSNCETYGGLYQWDQAMNYSTDEGTQGICPAGWHLPTDNEWLELEMFLGATESEANMLNTFRAYGIGTKLKEGGESNMEIMMGGGRNSGGGWQFLEGNSIEFGYFYTSTENGAYAYRRCLRRDNTGVGRYNNWQKTFGLSIRCVKD